MALDFCHALGMPVHDLRPHNMLLLENNDAPSLCRCAQAVQHASCLTQAVAHPLASSAAQWGWRTCLDCSRRRCTSERRWCMMAIVALQLGLGMHGLPAANQDACSHHWAVACMLLPRMVIRASVCKFVEHFKYG